MQTLTTPIPMETWSWCLRICNGVSPCGQRLPFEVVFMDEKQNLLGLQLADLVCYPIGRRLLNRSGERRLVGHGLETFP